MILLIDNNDGRGQQDYTAWVDAEHLPKITRKLNGAATMTAVLVNCGPGFTIPALGARVILQRGTGVTLFYPLPGYSARGAVPRCGTSGSRMALYPERVG